MNIISAPQDWFGWYEWDYSDWSENVLKNVPWVPFPKLHILSQYDMRVKWKIEHKSNFGHMVGWDRYVFFEFADDVEFIEFKLKYL